MPYSVVVLRHAFVALKNYASRTQMVHRPPNVRHGPPQHRVWSFVHAIDLLNPQHRVADLKHQCRRLIRYENQPEHPLIERSRPLGIRSRQEQDGFVESCHVFAE
jgi:hypothetical protein